MISLDIKNVIDIAKGDFDDLEIDMGDGEKILFNERNTKNIAVSYWLRLQMAKENTRDIVNLLNAESDFLEVDPSNQRFVGLDFFIEELLKIEDAIKIYKECKSCNQGDLGVSVLKDVIRKKGVDMESLVLLRPIMLEEDFKDEYMEVLLKNITYKYTERAPLEGVEGPLEEDVDYSSASIEDEDYTGEDAEGPLEEGVEGPLEEDVEQENRVISPEMRTSTPPCQFKINKLLNI